MNDKPIIDPQNLPTWTAVGFIIALLALVVALGGMYYTYIIFAVTQTQFIALEQKVDDQGKRLAGSPQAPAPQASAEKPAAK